MLTMLRNWKGRVEVNGTVYDSISEISPTVFNNGQINIKLLPLQEKVRTDSGSEEICDNREVRITVKQYMTRKASPEFDFMAKWNNDNPMPLRTMQGYIEKQTRGMVYMHLHGTGLQEVNCMRCGKRLTHPVSRHYGIGPECMQKVGIVADIEDVESIKEQLVKVEWQGWIIKSAITEQEEV